MEKHFERPSPVERFVNTSIGWLVGLGVGPGYARVLEVRGRKSGKTFTTPVNLLDYDGKLWLVGARGETQWVRNAQAAGEVVLARGRDKRSYRVQRVPAAQSAVLLREYLERYHSQVQRFFGAQRGAALPEFEAIADRHPVFELIAQ
jgi:deazaflavin-dependent oxidoreductase (nitroreductase family)